MRWWKYFVLPAAIVTLVSTGTAQEYGKLVLNHFVSDPDQTTRIYVTDFEGARPEVTVTFYSEAGDIIGQRTIPIPRNGTVPIKPFDIVQRKAVGNVRIDGKGAHVSAEYWQIIETDEFSYSVAVPGQPAKGYSSLVVQHFVSDPGLNTIIFLTNPNEGQYEGQSATVTLEFHSESGEVLSKTDRTISPNATLVLKPYDVLQKTVYGNVHIKARGAPVTGEYWQLVDVKRKDEKTGKKKEEKYAVAVPLQTLQLFSE
jgi:hypothetical protein